MASLLLEFAADQIQRGEAHFPGSEEQAAAIGLDRSLLGVRLALVFLALHDDRRLQPRDHRLRPPGQHDGVVDEFDRANALEPQIGGDVRAGVSVGHHAHDEGVAALGRETQQPQVAGMDDVPVARHEDDPLAPDLGADLSQLGIQSLLGVAHERPSSDGSISISGRPTRPASRSSSASLTPSSA